MDTLLGLWTYAPDLKVKLLLLAIVGQMMLTIHMYLQMSKVRVSAAKAGRIKPELYKATDNEPEDLRVFTRAVANQFELPVIFYALVVASVAAGVSSWITVILAWVFVILRVLHGLEMISTNAVIKRRKMFIRCLQVFLLMLVEFVVSVLIFAQG